MSRILKVMVALLAITALAAPAMAADNFSVSGQARAFLYHLDDGGDSTDTYAYHRLRIQGTFKATENVSVTFRFDPSEGNWGTDAGSGRFLHPTDWDRAFMDLKFDAFDLRVGQQFVGFGKSSALQWNEAGVTVKVKGDMPITLAYAVDTADTSGSNTAEPEKTLVGIGTKIAGFDLFAGMENDGSGNVTGNEQVYVFGAAGNIDLEAVQLVGEIDFFTGDADETNDAKGLQGFIDASMGVSEMTRVGGALYYAAGTDGGDYQYAQVGNYFGQWDPLSRGPFADEDFLFTGLPYTVFNSSKQQMDGAGVIAGQLYVDVNYNDATSLTASFAYAEPEEDANTAADSAMIGNLGLTYKLMDNANFIGQIQYVDYDIPNSDSAVSVGTGLVVTF